MSDQLRLGLRPIRIEDATVQFVEFMCQALCSEKGSFSQKDVEQALATVDLQSKQLMHRTFTKYLGDAEKDKRIAEIDKQAAEIQKQVAQVKADMSAKDKIIFIIIIAWLSQTNT